MTLADIAGSEDCLRAPRIDCADVRLLWHDDYWDGPRSGMLLYHGEECWFQVVAESEDNKASWYRRFAVLRFSPEQHAEESRWYELFRRRVGGYTDYDESGQRPVGALRPRDRWAEFYDAYR